jgi:hypothetical protein
MALSTFTLITSDDISIEVDSTLLSKHSTIFADMFEISSTTVTPSCTVSESESEINLMIEVLKEDKGEYDLDQIKTLVKLADKYDSRTLSYAAKGSLW